MFEQCINGDCAIVICKFLNPKDIITLYKMYPKILPKITRIFIRRVAEEIDYFFKDAFKEKYEEFRKCMISSNAMLSGSVILQKMLGERWPGHGWGRLDVDIFVAVEPIFGDEPHGDHKNFTFYNYKHKFKLGYKKIHKFLHKCRERKNGYNGYVTHSQYMNEFGEQVLLRLNQYVIDKTNIFQVVEINKDKFNNWQEFIDKTVDFDICKNMFYYSDDEEGFHLNIGSLTSIIHKQAKFGYVHSKDLSRKRREKYVERGFTFTNNI